VANAAAVLDIPPLKKHQTWTRADEPLLALRTAHTYNNAVDVSTRRWLPAGLLRPRWNIELSRAARASIQFTASPRAHLLRAAGGRTTRRTTGDAPSTLRAHTSISTRLRA